MAICKLNRRTFLYGSAAVIAGTFGSLTAGELMEYAREKTYKVPGAGMIPLIYSARYNISAFGLEYLHPFDSHKFARIHQHLIDAGLRKTEDFISPVSLSRAELLTVHTPGYLDSLNNSFRLAQIFELPPAALVPAPLLDWRVLLPMRLAAGGTLLACRLALERGMAINIGGGYHHADRDQGGGFCVYSDIPIALSILHSEGKIRRALIVDTDAHQGNGFANVIRDTGWAYGLDLFDEAIYPFPKVKEDMAVSLASGTGACGYFKALEAAVPEAVEKFKPDLIVHNAGSDVLSTDPLATLSLHSADLRRRDLYVCDQAKSRGIPLAMVLAGGYGRESAMAHASSIMAILGKYDLHKTSSAGSQV